MLNQTIFTKRFFKRLVPIFYIVTTLLIMIMNDVLGESEPFAVFSLLFFTSMLILLVRWLIIQIKFILRLKKEKKQAELAHLKSQVNPHFFFNTLNNLYGLIELDQGKAQQLVLKLSDMMRYSIYDGQHEQVALEDEIRYLENYIELHRMRYHKAIDIRFAVNVEDLKIKVMPLLFIIMLENAFKHGVEKLRKDAFVYIHLRADGKRIDFTIENNFDVEEVEESEGIGLKNLKQRLELVYPHKHELTARMPEKGIYKSRLILTV